jgi:histidyl-tRNA synthetase
VSQPINAPKGVPDYVPPRSRDFLHVRNVLAASAELAGYEYIELPVFESTELFVRGVGESTDVVSKEMYTFTDRGERSITLRPEGTAGVIRSIIENRLDKGSLPVKLWYAGPFFRAERPQQGRYRQLQQVGAEAVGSDDPAIDAEVISIAYQGFTNLGLKDFYLDLTSLGCATCRPTYRQILQEFLVTCELDQETRDRARINPLRVLDDKRESVQEQLHAAPFMVDHLCRTCQEHYDAVREFLKASNVSWRENSRLVRGLDYYTRTTFEFVHPGLGSQSGIGGGGRYDGLMAELGGSPMSGIGFGLGTDRTLLACEAEGLTPFRSSVMDIYFIALDHSSRLLAVQILNDLRRRGVSCSMSSDSKSLKASLKNADRSGAPFVAILGEEERQKNEIVVKNMATGDQFSLPSEAASIHELIRDNAPTHTNREA